MTDYAPRIGSPPDRLLSYLRTADIGTVVKRDDAVRNFGFDDGTIMATLAKAFHAGAIVRRYESGKLYGFALGDGEAAGSVEGSRGPHEAPMGVEARPEQCVDDVTFSKHYTRSGIRDDSTAAVGGAGPAHFSEPQKSAKSAAELEGRPAGPDSVSEAAAEAAARDAPAESTEDDPAAAFDAAIWMDGTLVIMGAAFAADGAVIIKPADAQRLRAHLNQFRSLGT